VFKEEKEEVEGQARDRRHEWRWRNWGCNCIPAGVGWPLVSPSGYFRLCIQCVNCQTKLWYQ